jgi:hypothetical protein
MAVIDPAAPVNFFTRLWLKITSWSRFSSAVCITVAVIQEFRDKDIAHITLWLLAGLGVYSAGKALSPYIPGANQ